MRRESQMATTNKIRDQQTYELITYTTYITYLQLVGTLLLDPELSKEL